MPEKLTARKIQRLQKKYGFKEMQDKINSGLIWRLEGSQGREASALLESGACMLPREFRNDYYGNKVPCRQVLKPGTKGTLENSRTFWAGVLDGSIEIQPELDYEDA